MQIEIGAWGAHWITLNFIPVFGIFATLAAAAIPSLISAGVGLFSKKSDGGGGGTSAPALDPRAQEFLDATLQALGASNELISQARKEGSLLLPALMQSIGLDASFDDGGLAGVSGGISQDILDQTRSRLQAALSGDFFDPALERELGQTKETRERGLLRALGPGFETSTAGAQGLSELDATQAIARFLARQEEIRGGTERSLALSGQLTGDITGVPQRLLGLTQASTQLAGTAAGAARGPLAFLLSQQQIGTERDLAQKELKESRLTGLFKLGGKFLTAKRAGDAGTSILQDILAKIPTGIG